MAVSTIDGRDLEGCDINFFRYKEFYLIIVSGATYNPCGHALLNIGGEGGFYVHIPARNQRPKILTESQYKTYLHARQKTEILRHHVRIGFPENALRYLENLMVMPWDYNVAFNNCAHFVEKVIKAGGGHINMGLHCPIWFGLKLRGLD